MMIFFFVRYMLALWGVIHHAWLKKMVPFGTIYIFILKIIDNYQ